MQWLSKFFPKRSARSRAERRSLENPAVPLNSYFWGPPALAGVNVSETSALSLSAFWCGTRTISVDFASLKIRPYVFDRGWTPALDHWSYRLTYVSPDGLRTAAQFWASICQHMITHGNGYAEILRAGNGWEGIGYELLNPDHVFPRFDHNPNPYYEVQGRNPRRILPWNMIHIANPMSFDGVVGRSIVHTARESIGLGLAVDLAMASYYGNASRPNGRITTPPNHDIQAANNTRDYYDQLNAGPFNNGRDVVDLPGCQWNPMSLPAPDEAYLKSREFQVSEIARWFPIPPSKLGAGVATNMEQENIAYKQTTIRPIAEFACAQLNLKLLTPEERETMEFRPNYEELDAADLAAKTTHYATGCSWGWYSPNMSLHAFGKNGIGAEGDTHLVPQNMIPADRLQEWADNLLAQKSAPTNAPSNTAPEQQPAGTDPNKLTSALRTVVADSLGRMLRREVAAVRRAAKKPGFADFLDEFYLEHRTLMAEALEPSLVALNVASGARVSATNMADSWVIESRKELVELADAIHSDELGSAVDDLTSRWESKRLQEALCHLTA